MEIDRHNVDDFTRAYIEAALWSSDNEECLDDCDIDDFSEETFSKIVEDCRKFQEDNGKLLVAENFIGNRSGEYNIESMAGHDFWLTRAHHGAGFWDGDWEEEVGQQLTDAAHKFPEVTVYLGDDGKLYIDG